MASIRRHSSSVSRTSASSGVLTPPSSDSSRWRAISGLTRRRWSMPIAPALLMRMSIGPSSASTRSIAASTDALSLTSQTTAKPPPAMAMLFSAVSSRMSSAATRTPSAASLCTIARPIPAPPPVTTATLPSRVISGLLPLHDVADGLTIPHARRIHAGRLELRLEHPLRVRARQPVHEPDVAWHREVRHLARAVVEQSLGRDLGLRTAHARHHDLLPAELGRHAVDRGFEQLR